LIAPIGRRRRREEEGDEKKKGGRNGDIETGWDGIGWDE
jgi:hypothetical protein